MSQSRPRQLPGLTQPTPRQLHRATCALAEAGARQLARLHHPTQPPRLLHSGRLPFPAIMQGRPPASHSPAATISGIVGIGLYLVVGFFYLSSGLVVPGPWLLILWAIWLAGIYVLVLVFRRRRAWTPLVAVAAAAVWWIYVTVGEAVFGWTP